MRTPKTSTPSVLFTEEMFQEIENFKNSKYMSWNEFFKFAGIASKTTIDYWKKTGRISFNALKKLKRVGLDLYNFQSKNDKR